KQVETKIGTTIVRTPQTMDMVVLVRDTNIKWYSGDDPSNKPQQYVDFETVMLHEICHGLGFISLFFADRPTTSQQTPLGHFGNDQILDAIKTLGVDLPFQPPTSLNARPCALDVFVVDSGGKKLCSDPSIGNGTVELGKRLLGKFIG